MKAFENIAFRRPDRKMRHPMRATSLAIFFPTFSARNEIFILGLNHSRVSVPVTPMELSRLNLVPATSFFFSLIELICRRIR